MQEVAHHLQMQAIKEDRLERDIYARSAYNRYYYTVFLSAREMLAELNPNWKNTAHKSYPDTLKGIQKTFNSEKRRASKNKDYNLVDILDKGMRAAKALASLMEKANGVRIVADYYPETIVEFNNSNRFSLNNIKITEAHSWHEQVTLWTNEIKLAWRQINA